MVGALLTEDIFPLFELPKEIVNEIIDRTSNKVLACSMLTVSKEIYRLCKTKVKKIHNESELDEMCQKEDYISIIYSNIDRFDPIWLYHAMYGACFSGDNRLIYYILNKLANKSQAWTYGLNGAARRGHLDTFKFVLYKCIDISEDSRWVRQQIQMYFPDILDNACWSGNIELVKYILTMTDWTPRSLYHACKSGNINLVKMLLNPDFKISRDKLNIAVKGACHSGDMEIINLIFSYGGTDFIFALHGACEGGHIDILKFIIDKSASTVSLDDLDTACIFNACYNGHLNMIKYMVDNDPNFQRNAKQYLYGASMKKVHLEMFKYILDKVDVSNTIALQHGFKCACYGGYIELFDLLIKKGAVYSTSVWNTGLSIACKSHNSQEMIDFIISKGANNCISCQNKEHPNLQIDKPLV